jgi:hypothetical protein
MKEKFGNPGRLSDRKWTSDAVIEDELFIRMIEVN